VVCLLAGWIPNFCKKFKCYDCAKNPSLKKLFYPAQRYFSSSYIPNKSLMATYLEVARIESEQLTLRRAHFNLRQVILDTIFDHKRQIANGEYAGLVKGRSSDLI
jgi:hypothetical protein